VVLSERFGSSDCYQLILSVRSEKNEFGRIFGSLVAFSNRWRMLAGRSRAPVNWDRWAAPEERLVYPQDKPNCSRGIERSEHSPNFCPYVFLMLWWRECCQHFVQHSMLGLFQTAGNFLHFSKAIYGVGWAEHSEVFSSRKCFTHFT